MKESRIHKFVGDQLSCWPLACDNFRALKNVRVREIEVGGLTVKLQFNPARIVSSAAKLSKEDIARRRCFLCRENRPDIQKFIRFEGRKGKKYHILINPYPIFPDHLVIAMNKHVDQSIWNRYVDMLDLARKYNDFTFFYNGPKSGASAPDHHHFQGAPQGLMPLEIDVEALIADQGDALRYVSSVQDADLYHYDRFTHGVFVLRARTSKSAAKMFYRLLDCAEIPEGENEPLINLFTYYRDGEFRSIVVFRKSHRSHHYFSDGPDHLTMSPGCADMAGVFIVPVEEEYDKITPELLGEMLQEVSVPKEEQDRIIWRLTRTQPMLEVGIMSGPELVFEILSDGAGLRTASLKEGKIEYGGALYDELFFDAETLSTMFAQPSFILHDVTIGVGFHWERKESQKFAGALKIIVDKGKLTAVNVIGVEDYLLSVISSEMSASATEEFLKAHAVISRSWVMAQIASSRRHEPRPVPEGVCNVPTLMTDLDARLNFDDTVKTEHTHRYTIWYDHEDHHSFDVCADDHCQRYQGLTRATGSTVRKAIDSTWGQVLTYDGALCDARFSKCCGGRMEVFSTCWDDKDYPYLQPLPDTAGHQEGGECFCNTQNKEILGQVLNGYDQETVDFYRWKVEYDRKDLGVLIARRSGVDLGPVRLMTPVETGPSGRIYKLRIEGENGTMVVGKELEIRRILSESHLKSSAFDVRYDGEMIILEGAGWGHGVGLCQIGAAVMASKGYTYRQILEHYYPQSEIE
jgi:SpoIID/LytB domain protein